ncbi:L10-interacting myb domain-containing protein-like [Thalictrum thalictroides]|uniref:L10-interacting myb domain-containing protein-like n=1 Tax=Thalictrum thalictroides TaxID=46969 RepID=A0A7J6UU52_THATH|nr:L10-interacting myb domain-containing protein-like [Thalictrum thalictroides]
MSSSKSILLPFEQASEEAQADWKPAQKYFTINWMKEHVIARREGRVVGTFSKSEWIELRKECYKAWGLKYSSKAFKNKFTSLKERFKEFKKLVEATSRLGWNPVLSTIDASDIWWNEYGKMKYLKRFRGLGCPEYKDLEVIFGDTISTRHLQTTENHDFDSTDRDDSLNDVNLLHLQTLKM